MAAPSAIPVTPPQRSRPCSRARPTPAFLLDPTPVEAVLAVAEAGELMPQKSTYFAPKPATGLVFDMGGS